MNGPDEGLHLAVGQSLAIGLATTLLRMLAADAGVEHIAHFGQRQRLALPCNPCALQGDFLRGSLHRTSLVMYAVAIFKISFSRLSRRLSLRSLDSSSSSALTTLPPAPLSLPFTAALIQLRKVWSLSSSSLQTIPALCPSLKRLTASSLNSAVYACFSIFISCPLKVTPILGHPWQTKFRGKLNFLAASRLGARCCAS